MRLIRRIKERRRVRREEWESICNRCGLCCYQKRYSGGGMIIDLNAPCPHLDAESGLCKVYDNRFRVCPDCKKVTMYHALFSSMMPAECAYVQRYRKLKLLIPTARIYGTRPAHLSKCVKNSGK